MTEPCVPCGRHTCCVVRDRPVCITCYREASCAAVAWVMPPPELRVPGATVPFALDPTEVRVYHTRKHRYPLFPPGKLAGVKPKPKRPPSQPRDQQPAEWRPRMTYEEAMAIVRRQLAEEDAR